MTTAEKCAKMLRALRAIPRGAGATHTIKISDSELDLVLTALGRLMSTEQREPEAPTDFRKRLDELTAEIATLRGEVRFLLDHVSGLENASGLRLEDDDRRRYEEIAERFWGLSPEAMD